MPPTLHDDGEVVRESIIQNKERTKSYWEQLMMAAAANNSTTFSSNTSLNHSNSRNSICSTESSEDGPNVKEEKRRIERELALGHVPNVPHLQTMQEKIVMELKLMQQREEELRIARSLSMDMKTSSQDGSNCSEYGSDESNRGDSLRNRAQSMESVSSGLSLGSGSGIGSGSGSAGNSAGVADVSLIDVPRRKRDVVVRPLEDPEEEQVTVPRYAHETPIEREIRLACEREAELRKDKGLEEVKTVAKEVAETPAETREDAFVDAPVRESTPLAAEQKTEVLDVQMKLATHRIEKEIAEAGERETQLRSLGRIKTTSSDTVDSKVTKYTDLVDATTQDKSRRTRRSLAAPLPEEEPLVTRKFSMPDKKFNTTNSQRGLMQRFIASKGRLQIAPAAQPIVPIQRPVSPPTPPPMATPPTRNGFMSAEEKIQSELREMQRREEELRLQRAHLMARSQPNLLAIGDDEEATDEARDEDVTTPEPRPLRHASLPHFASNPTLTLNPKISTISVSNGRRKRFSLLEEWENRIQNS